MRRPPEDLEARCTRLTIVTASEACSTQGQNPLGCGDFAALGAAIAQPERWCFGGSVPSAGHQVSKHTWSVSQRQEGEREAIPRTARRAGLRRAGIRRALGKAAKPWRPGLYSRITWRTCRNKLLGSTLSTDGHWCQFDTNRSPQFGVWRRKLYSEQTAQLQCSAAVEQLNSVVLLNCDGARMRNSWAVRTLMALRQGGP